MIWRQDTEGFTVVKMLLEVARESEKRGRGLTLPCIPECFLSKHHKFN